MPTPAVEAPLELRTSRGGVELGFVLTGGELLLVARERSAVWPVEILRDGQAEVRLPDGSVVGGATELLSDPASVRGVLDRFRSKYGDARFARWYDHPARIVRVTLGTAPVGPSAGSYGRWIEAEFDSIAEEYDRHILGNEVNRLLRDRSLARLRSVFARPASLLDVGCGSGMETLPMLRDGHQVTAVDVSQRMLDVVRRKAAAEGLGERLRCVHLRARDLATLARSGEDPRFDGAYSTYGALNCEPDLGPFARGLAGLLAPGAPFVAGVYNRWCLFEVAAYAVTGQPRRAMGRWRNPVRVGSSRFCVDVFAYSVPTFERRLFPFFVPVSVEGVPVTLPPSDLSPYLRKLGRRLEVWARWDRSLGGRWPWRYVGDHFLATFVRAPGAAV